MQISRISLKEILSYTRFVPNSISNNVTLSNYTKMLSNTTKNDLRCFLEILKWVRWRKENWTIVFILVHSMTELHPVYQDNLNLISTIIKSFTNHKPRLHFWIIENTMIFDSHRNLNHNLVRITITNLKVALPSHLISSSSSLYQVKMPSRSTKIFNLHPTTMWFRERDFSSDEWQVFALKNSKSCLCSLKHNLHSLVLSEINRLNFSYILLISFYLNEISW